MASSYKYFADHDRVVTVNNLTEVVTNVKDTGWAVNSTDPKYFLQVASGSATFVLATRVFDVTEGRSSVTTNGTSTDFQAQKNIYNQLAKTLLGYDSSNNIQKFDLDMQGTNTKVLHNALFINFARSQFKDRIKQGSVKLTINVNGSTNIELTDVDTTIRECRTGNYGQLKISTNPSGDVNINSDNEIAGLIFYEAGVAVVSPYIFSKYNALNSNPSNTNINIVENILGILTVTAPDLVGSEDIKDLLIDSTIDACNNAISTKIVSAEYHSITELNSSVYFCRAYNHEFNYSSNPTYLKDSEIVVKGGGTVNSDPEAQPLAYITTVGLYSDDNQLLAVAKLSEPIKKTPDNELIARVRLDF